MLTPRGSSSKKNEHSRARALYSSESSTAGSAEKRTRIEAVEKSKVKHTILQSSSGDSSDLDAFLESQKRKLVQESEKQRNTNNHMKTYNESGVVFTKSNINNLYPILESLPEESSQEETETDDLNLRFFKFICCL